MINNIEILAPAGSYEAMIAAVRNGADAVYLGSKALNARRNATNFDDEELLNAVKYCHERGVKVHQTLNTLMYDNERDEVINAIKTAVQVGVDALIIQDLGVMGLAKQLAPNMSLHASTQMAIHNLEGAKEAVKLGFLRIVLARELSKDEIEYITQNIPIETEVFVHGALCMCVSGQCYLSSMIGERSGNRGLCAQPCRLPFKAEGGTNEYALSLKDLSIADKVNELAQIGVSSIKIEGRMKRPEYVAAVVSEIKKCVSNNEIDYKTLKSVFSRNGFTNGYYMGNVDYEMFGTRQKDDVLAASNVLKDLEKTYAKETNLIAIDMKLFIQQNENVKLICSDKLGNICESTAPSPEIALNKPTTAEKAEQSLSKTGGTPYFIDKFEAIIDDGLIVPVSVLNSLRRECLEKLSNIRSSTKEMQSIGKIMPVPKISADLSVMPKIRVRVSTALQITPYILENAQMIIIPVAQLNAWVKKGGKIEDNICGELSAIDFSPDYSINLIKKLKEQGLKHIYASNLWAFYVAKELGIAHIHCGFNLNIFNSDALYQYAKMGAEDAELSFELNLNKIKDINRTMKCGIVAYGYLPLMTLRNCPVDASVGCDNCNSPHRLKDRKGVEFFVSCEGGQSRLYNSVPLYLADRFDELKGIDFITLYLTMEKPEQCDRIYNDYVQKISYNGNITRGLYYRNVL